MSWKKKENYKCIKEKSRLKEILIKHQVFKLLSSDTALIKTSWTGPILYCSVLSHTTECRTVEKALYPWEFHPQ
uniref:Uncharacterized protein n=1 Tax=Rhizophagus irregularis (strain DAOM 181602 / DAOM 197198 / MUCL 43194) TaxID=747089 RepID=U9THJ1_RHIID